ncbi:mannosyltransferase putative-domain-containing protein [Globomyces pollinis-pini]|nr:mannosyltransferase putative-domain-containing protein [Globomyces pollinis-pini]
MRVNNLNKVVFSLSARRKRNVVICISFIIFMTWYWTTKPNTVQILEQKTILKETINFQLSEDQKDLLSIQNDQNDISIHGKQLRLYSQVHLANLNDSYSNSIQLSHLAGVLDHKLFPWIMPKYSDSIELHQSFNGTGIVLCVNNGYTLLALTTMKMIRQNLKSNLPFEIFYVGDDDLSVKNRKLLEEIPFVTTIDITKIFNNSILKIKGWAIKPFALLASSFRHAMLMDADVVFLQPPEKLFDLESYKRTGAFFFHDRSLFIKNQVSLDWVKHIVGEMTSTMKDLRLFNQKTAHEMESGVVLIDKMKNFVGLMTVCTLNSAVYQKQSYSKFHGDKETFWIGFETVRALYSFNANLPGVAGTSSVRENEYVMCGTQILHLDEDKQPLWINGGITKSKYDPESEVADLHEWGMTKLLLIS